MKYFVRAIKYFFYFAMLFFLILGILVYIGAAKGDFSSMFRDGYNSLVQIGLLFLVVSAFYPKLGFARLQAEIDREYPEMRQGIIDYMESRGYRLESEEGENLTFRLRSKVTAVFRMLEDRMTLTRNEKGFEIEGLRKDVVRIVGGLEYKFRRAEDEN